MRIFHLASGTPLRRPQGVMKTSTSNSDYVDIKGIRNARGYVRTKFIRPVVELRLSTRKLLPSNAVFSLSRSLLLSLALSRIQ